MFFYVYNMSLMRKMPLCDLVAPRGNSFEAIMKDDIHHASFNLKSGMTFSRTPPANKKRFVRTKIAYGIIRKQG